MPVPFITDPTCYQDGDVDTPCPPAKNPLCLLCREAYDQTACMMCPDCNIGLCYECYGRGWMRPDGSGHMETCPRCVPHETAPYRRNMVSVTPLPTCDKCGDEDAGITSEDKLCVLCK